MPKDTWGKANNRAKYGPTKKSQGTKSNKKIDLSKATKSDIKRRNSKKKKTVYTDTELATIQKDALKRSKEATEDLKRKRAAQARAKAKAIATKVSNRKKTKAKPETAKQKAREKYSGKLLTKGQNKQAESHLKSILQERINNKKAKAKVKVKKLNAGVQYRKLARQVLSKKKRRTESE